MGDEGRNEQLQFAFVVVVPRESARRVSSRQRSNLVPFFAETRFEHCPFASSRPDDPELC